MVTKLKIPSLKNTIWNPVLYVRLQVYVWKFYLPSKFARQKKLSVRR